MTNVETAKPKTAGELINILRQFVKTAKDGSQVTLEMRSLRVLVAELERLQALAGESGHTSHRPEGRQ